MRRAPVPSWGGQTLIELLMALGAGVLIIVAIIAGVVTAGRNSQFAKNQSLASSFAQEGIELIRSQRAKLGWAAFVTAYTNNPLQCIDSAGNFTNGSGSCSPNVGANNFFTRSALFSVNASALNVIVTVSWQDTIGTHESRQTTLLTSWQ